RRHRRIVVNAGIVDENLDRAAVQKPNEGGFGGCRIGHVESEGFSAAAGFDDRGGLCSGALQPLMRVDIDVMPRRRERARNRRADRPAAARDEGALHSASASRMTVARPATSSRPSPRTAKE